MINFGILYIVKVTSGGIQNGTSALFVFAACSSVFRNFPA